MTEILDHEPPPIGDDLARSNLLLKTVTRALGQYFRDAEPGVLFSQLLGDLLALTSSRIGYIAEVRHEDGRPYLQTRAISDVAWDEATRRQYREEAVGGDGLEFRNMATLFGWGVLERSTVISNDPAGDPRGARVPAGHPRLETFMAIPIVRGSEMIGQLAVADRPGGYDEELVAFLEPFTSAVGNLIEAYRGERERRAAQDELRRSKQWYEALVANLSDLVSVHEADGTLRFASSAAAKLLGRYPRPGTDVASYIHPDDLPGALDTFAAVLRGERRTDEPFEFRILDVDGEYRTLQSIGEDLRGDDAIGGVVVTSRDVTEQVLAEQRLAATTSQLATLVSSLRDGVLFVDDRGDIVVANQAFCRIFAQRVAPESLAGRAASVTRQFATPLVEDPARFSARIDECYAAGVAQVGEELRFTDGRTMERDYLPINLGGERRGHLWLYRDVTERKLVEAQRLRILQREREMRAATEQQNESLRELAELKDDFVAMVSHELRTPLTSVVGFTGLLLEDDASLNDEQREFLAAIDRNANRLLRLVGDLLLLARLEAGSQQLAIAAVDPSALVASVVESLRPEADERSVTLSTSISAPPVVYVDPGRIEQVLSNLLSNAVKFTAPGGRAEVEVTCDERWWTIAVRDNGIGIPIEEQPQLFQRFYRGSNARAAATPGTGLGLVISKAIVELHGGAIDLESAAGIGTTVTIRLPVPERPPA